VLSIRPNPRQPRKAFGDDEMAELSTRFGRSDLAAGCGATIPSEELADGALRSDGVQRRTSS